MGALVKKLDEIGVEWADPQEHGVGRALFNRILHLLARNLPGSMSLRVSLHKARGVKFHGSAFISSDVYIDDGHPEYLEIGNEVSIGVRAVIITHMREHVSRTVIEDSGSAPASTLERTSAPAISIGTWSPRGTTIRLGALRMSGPGGSFSKTSRAAPAMRPPLSAEPSADSSMTLPLDALTRKAVFFIMEIRL